jgi:CDP-diacylglycerol---glycerol-3-phosphate 3-phosphatidyltransferase
MDLVCSIALGALLVVCVAAYAVRLALRGRARSARVEAEGESMLMGKGSMEMMVWCAQPVVSACARLGVTPDAVTLASLVLGVAAGAAFGAGHFGVGAVLALAAGAGDTMDGLLAKKLGTASDAGEVLDAAVDRYVDFAWFAGVAYWMRESRALLLIALGALLGSIMVSYSTAKAEALHVRPPRGSMRRVERAALIVVAATVTPVVAWAAPAWAAAPLAITLGTIAVLGNASALRRLAAVRAAVRGPARGAVHGGATP